MLLAEDVLGGAGALVAIKVMRRQFAYAGQKARACQHAHVPPSAPRQPASFSRTAQMVGELCLRQVCRAGRDMLDASAELVMRCTGTHAVWLLACHNVCK